MIVPFFYELVKLSWCIQCPLTAWGINSVREHIKTRKCIIQFYISCLSILDKVLALVLFVSPVEVSAN